MSKRDQDRITELQRQVAIAKRALELIAHGHSRKPETTASDALDKMWPLDPKQQLQGLVGHDRRRT